MRTSRTAVAVVVLGALVAGLAAGCASRGTVKPITTTADLAALAGRWEGFGTGAGGGSRPASMEIGRDGRYRAVIGAFTSSGSLRLAGGGVATVPDGAARGAFATDHGATGELREREGRQILSLEGRSDRGPYSLEVTKRP